MNKQRSFTTSAELDTALADHLAQLLRIDIDANGCAALALSGGGTPKNMFTALSKIELDWSRVIITLVDERWVDPASPDSNERMLRQQLLQNCAAKAQFIGLKTPQGDADEGLPELRRRLAQLPQRFSAVVLGMGADGHTASWFPGADNLSSLLDPVNGDDVAATTPPEAPHQRATLTLARVLRSAEIIIHVTGAEKAAVLERAIDDDLPIAAILRQSTTPATLWWAAQ